MFKAFKPSGMEKIARAMGYQGNMQGFQDYLAQDPMRQQQMQNYQQKAIQMARGGVVKMQAGGSVTDLEKQLAELQAKQKEYEQNYRNVVGSRSQYDTADYNYAVLQFRRKYGNNYRDRIRASQQQLEAARKAAATPPPAAKPPENPYTGLPQIPAKPPQKQPKPPAAPPAIKTTMMVGEEGGQMPDFGKPAKTRAVGEDEPGGIGGGPALLPKTQAVGEDEPTPGDKPILAKTMAVGEDEPGGIVGEFSKPLSQQPSTQQPAVAQPEPVTINGITYNSYTRAVGETPQPPPLSQQPSTQQPAVQPTGPYAGLPQQPVPVTSGPAGPAQDPYAQYRTNVERFPGTNQLKNPAIQTQFDEMTKALEEDADASDPYKKTRAILDYVQTLYTGPITLGQTGVTGLGANELTPEFQKFARDVGINIKEGPAADGPKVLELVENSPIATTAGYLPPPPQGQNIQDFTVQQFAQPALPEGGAVAAVGIQAEADQMIDPTTGQVTGSLAVPTTMATTAQATAPQESQAAQVQANTAAPAVASALDATQAAQGTVDPRAELVAAQQTASSVGNLNAAQGNAILLNNPVQREIQAGELISGVADAQKAAQFTEQVEAATATPSDQATVQGQLAQLTANFDAKNPPAWAAGALRNATSRMASRGLGASSIAGQAIVQATLEAALPIASADAATVAQFEAQNLSNKQQRAMLAAQQRAEFMGMEFTQAFQARVQNAAKVSEIANINFTAEQQVQLENSRIANTMNMQNLSNNQALVMSEAAALAQMDAANLNNRQQAAVQNAQNFLQMDMANLSNRQQVNMFKAQQRVQSLFTDQAAQNAAAQFNATSQNQVDQFFASLNSQVSQFNTSQANAQSQFNAGQRNTVERFNAELNNQRDQFNATNQLAIAQNNAVWRREIATANTAAINRANELNASALLDISKNAYDNLWTYYADTMEWAWTSAENELDRINSMAIAQLSADAQAAATKAAGKTAAGAAVGSLIGTLGSAFIEFCWVAREVYGPSDIRWFIFRDWMKKNAPRWLYKLYVKHGEDFAKYIKDKPKIKFVLRQMMNLVVKKPKVRYDYVK